MVLSGTAVAAASGAVAGSTTDRGRRALHRIGIIGGPDRRPPPGGPPVAYGTLRSAAMRRTVGHGLSRPEDEPELILVCLHGRGADHRYAFDTIGVHRFAAAAGLSWLVASIDGGPSSYWHRRSDGTDAQRLLFEEFLPMVRPQAPTAPNALLGWSMGGFGALLAGATRPDEFLGVVASSPALWRRPEDTAEGAFDGPADFRRHDIFGQAEGLRRVRVRVDCGEDDPFASAARDLLRLVPTATGGIRAGFHDAGFWRSVLPDQLAQIRRWRRAGAMAGVTVGTP